MQQTGHKVRGFISNHTTCLGLASGSRLVLLKLVVTHFHLLSESVGNRVVTVQQVILSLVFCTFVENGLILFRYDHKVATDTRLCDSKTYFARTEEEVLIEKKKRVTG